VIIEGRVLFERTLACFVGIAAGDGEWQPLGLLSQDENASTGAG